MTRQRLTITLKNDILKLLDGYIDGEKIRNRSHAVEFLLSQSLVPKGVKVLILAGGEGVKFRPLTYELPKAMIPLAGKPLLEHTIERLVRSGLTDIIVSIGYLGEKVRNYFGDGTRFGAHITYLDQTGLKNGTAQPLRQARKLLEGNSFLLIYGDVLADIHYADLIEFHRSVAGSQVTMALTSVETIAQWGSARVVGNKIVEFVEKPKTKNVRSHLVNAGMYVIEPAFFNLLDEKAIRLESDVLPKLSEQGKLSAYPFDGTWFDISTPEIYEKALKFLKQINS